MSEPVRFTRITEAYSTGSSAYSRQRSLPGNRLGDTVQISREAYEKSREYMMQLKDVPSSDPSLPKPSPKLQTENDPEILSLPPDATRDQIRKAYIGAIKRYHPDNFAGLSPEFAKLAEEKSKQINLAYKKLTSM
jgi:DnaJ-domain-containing protein 1